MGRAENTDAFGLPLNKESGRMNPSCLKIRRIH